MDAFFDILNLNPNVPISPTVLVPGLATLGLILGVLTGLFGVGGGFMVVPLMQVLFGIPYPLAIGSSLCFIVGTSAGGLMHNIRQGKVELRSMLILAAGSACGTIVGSQILNALKAATDETQLRNLMNCLFIVLLLATAGLVWRGPKAHTSGKTPLQRLPLGPYVELPAAGLSHVSLPGLCLMSLGVGLLTGLLGVGGGVLFMPLLLLVLGLNTHQAVGTSLGVILLASIVGTAMKGAYGQVSLSIVAALLVGSTIGVQIGVWLCQKLHAARLRRYFAILVLLVVVMLIVDLVINLIAPPNVLP